MNKFILIISTCILLYMVSGCQEQLNTNNVEVKNDKQINNEILGTCQVFLDEEYYLELIMYEGKYYVDTEVGAFEGENWVGDCKLVIKRDEKIEYEYLLDEDWSEEMRFGSHFEIEIYDYDNDGQPEFLLGQYMSSNINEYKLYRITNEKTIEMINGGENINISGKERYSCKFNIDDNHKFFYEYYDNSTSQNKKRIVKFEGESVFIE